MIEDSASRLRLCALNLSPIYGGAERSFEILLSGLAQLDTKIDINALVDTPRLAQGLRKNGIAVSLFGRQASRWGMLSVMLFALFLPFYVIWKRPDHLVANGQRAALALLPILVFSPGNRQTWLFVRDFRWRTSAVKWLLRIRAVTFLSPSQFLLDQYGLPPQRCAVVPNAVASVHDENAATECNSLPRDGFHLLSVAHIAPWKGLELAIRTVARLTVEGYPVELRILGRVVDSDYYRSLLTLTRQLQVTGGVRFVGFGEDMPAQYEWCDVVCITSISSDGGPESFGRGLIEAWNNFRPVVAFAAGAISEVTAGGRGALLVDEGDYLAFSEELKRLRADSSLRQALIRDGRALLVERYTAQRVAALFSSLLRN